MHRSGEGLGGPGGGGGIRGTAAPGGGLARGHCGGRLPAARRLCAAAGQLGRWRAAAVSRRRHAAAGSRRGAPQYAHPRCLTVTRHRLEDPPHRAQSLHRRRQDDCDAAGGDGICGAAPAVPAGATRQLLPGRGHGDLHPERQQPDGHGGAGRPEQARAGDQHLHAVPAQPAAAHRQHVAGHHAGAARGLRYIAHGSEVFSIVVPGRYY
mmetsp:Transcript_9239/g.23786  ORF Transcript_9239/g.23786 Transcript_9239/m.23786 type:complete len:209 (+) Transcript_9239:799-1425(+)